MPGATLSIEPGVEMEFYPSVGILVLGTLHAQGNLERNIIMRPVELENVHDYRVGRQLGKPPITNQGRIRHDDDENRDPRAKSGSTRSKRHTEDHPCQDGLNGTLCHDDDDKTLLPEDQTFITESGNPVRKRRQTVKSYSNRLSNQKIANKKSENEKPHREPRLNRSKRHVRISDEEDFEVRLCQANRNGTICPEGIDQGFVEIFNKTTFQWVPICDERFSERNAEVVCRQLGFSTLNVYLDFEQRIEYR